MDNIWNSKNYQQEAFLLSLMACYCLIEPEEERLSCFNFQIFKWRKKCIQNLQFHDSKKKWKTHCDLTYSLWLYDLQNIKILSVYCLEYYKPVLWLGISTTRSQGAHLLVENARLLLDLLRPFAFYILSPFSSCKIHLGISMFLTSHMIHAVFLAEYLLCT